MSGRDLGDFQTPPELVSAVLDALGPGPIGRRWPRALEPTCGRGHFLAGLLGRDEPPREILGIEIQPGHADAAREATAAATSSTSPPRVEVLRASLFDLDLRRDLTWRDRGPLLVVGNPPWVTNAALGTLGSVNLPPKRNVSGARGLDARTGAANFDIAEAIWLKLLDELAPLDGADALTIAMLCKLSVARKVLEHARRRALPIAGASLSRIEARRWFGAEVEACLFRLSLGDDTAGPWAGIRDVRVPVYGDLAATTPDSEIGWARDRPVADVAGFDRWAFADGQCPLVWRQGLKHDAADVMELTLDGDGVSVATRNKLGEAVEVEVDHLYPLLKGADLARPGAPRSRRGVVVTQTRIGQDTRPLERTAPRLWAYLSSYAEAFARRKSSIYRGQPPFAIFGIGPYSFAPWKVAVSGLHKVPRFRAIGPVGGRPVMLDDTAYFLACRSPEQAAFLAALLDDEAARGLLRCLTFPDAKRPITKAVLQRIDLVAIAARADRPSLLARADSELARLLGDAPVGPRPAWPETFEGLLVGPTTSPTPSPSASGPATEHPRS